MSIQTEGQLHLWKTKYALTQALSYRPARHSAEMILIDKVFGHIPKGSVLDIPCGKGRFTTWLSKKAYRVTAVDYSESMCELTRMAIDNESVDALVIRGDVENLIFPDRQFRTVFCFRLFHHFPNVDIRRSAVAEICRVAEEYVAISYFSPFSFSSLKNELKRRYLNKKLKKYATPIAEVDAYFNEQEFGRVRNFPLCNFIHTLHIALYRRKQKRSCFTSPE